MSGNFAVEAVEGSAGPGNVFLIELRYENVTEVFTGFGEVRVPADRVAEAALRQARRYLKASVPVGRYLADQLLLPLAIGAWQGSGGGSFRTLELSRHSTTHAEILRAFLGVEVDIEHRARDDVFVRVG